MKSFLLVVFLAAGISITFCADAVTSKQSVGSDVTVAAIRRLQDTCIFNNDLLFMRRLAFHESNDGKSLSNYWNTDYGKGGIWQTTVTALNRIQTSQTLYANATREQLLNSVNVDIEGINRENGDLEIPLNSVAASRMYLSLFENLGNTIPVDLAGQANYWVQYYRPATDNRNAQDFISNSNKMQKCKPPGMDLIFIIDSSNSIGATQFGNNRKFIQAVIQGLNTYQKNRVGIITFSTVAKARLNLTDDLTKAISVAKNLPYDAQDTSITAGLNATYDMFNRFGRFEVPLVAILITDGDQNLPGNPATSADRLKSLNVNLFTVGVGKSADTNLVYWSSTPHCMYHYALTDYQQLGAAFPDLLNAQICEVSAFAPDNQTSLEGTVDENQSLFYQISATPSTGITLRLNVDNGIAAIYASLTSRLPSISDFQFSALATADKLGQFYITPKDLGFLPGADVTVYTAIVGVTNSTDFVLHYEPGNKMVTYPPSTTTTPKITTTTKTSSASTASLMLNILFLASIFRYLVV